jgi:hypothetical protein
MDFAAETLQLMLKNTGDDSQAEEPPTCGYFVLSSSNCEEEVRFPLRRRPPNML